MKNVHSIHIYFVDGSDVEYEYPAKSVLDSVHRQLTDAKKKDIKCHVIGGETIDTTKIMRFYTNE